MDVVKTAIPPMEDLLPKISTMLESRRLSNNGAFVREFEQMVCEKLDVRNCVATCNGTLSLVLALNGMNLKGKVVVPSFTFCATVHAVVWAGLEPVFADIDPETLSITPETVERVLTPDVVAVMPVTIYGSPCDVNGFQNLAETCDLKLIFDSAQGMGSAYKGHRLGGFGDAESFSVHATKIVPAGEGGLLTTDDDDLAAYLRSARNFGVDGDSDCMIPGLNAKMAEFSAIMGIEGLKQLDSAIENRRRLVSRYEELLRGIPGIKLQAHLPDSRTNHQNFIVIIDENDFGMSRDALSIALLAENIRTRKYFFPPIHATTAYVGTSNGDALPFTTWASERVLSLPLHTEMSVSDVEKVCEAMGEIDRHAGEILAASPSGRMQGRPQICF
jgi:dTDP-4-amino-4,6-dideoxygalactose transaminase